VDPSVLVNCFSRHHYNRGASGESGPGKLRHTVVTQGRGSVLPLPSYERS
jgi:hypothetical protein